MSASVSLHHLANLLGAFVSELDDRIEDASRRAADGGGALPAALVALDTWPGSSVEFLCGVLGITHSGAVRLVDRLDHRGWVRRRPGADARTLALALTPSGARRANAVRDARRTLLGEVVGALDPMERQVLGRALDRLLRTPPRTRTEARHRCRLCDHSVCRDAACPVGSSVPEA